jgi:hypothetical protein
MKSKLLSTFSMLRFFIVAALTVFCVSCDKTETTDSTGFILHYLGVTDIGPGPIHYRRLLIKVVHLMILQSQRLRLMKKLSATTITL